MNYIAIDCTSDSLCILGRKGDKFVTKVCHESKMQHSVLCMPQIEELLTELNLTIQECHFICGVTGAGSFTGIRVGLATVLGFAVAANKKTVGITAFQMLACRQKGRFLAVVDAGKNQYYVCGYQNEEIILPARHISFSELEALAKEYMLYSFTPLPVAHQLLDRAICLESAIQEAIQRGLEGYPLVAYYVKKSQAEENLLK